MQITDVRIRRVEKEGKMKAVVQSRSMKSSWYMILRSLKGKKVFLLQCQAGRQRMENTVILHIRSTPERESGSRN